MRNKGQSHLSPPATANAAPEGNGVPRIKQFHYTVFGVRKMLAKAVISLLAIGLMLGLSSVLSARSAGFEPSLLVYRVVSDSIPKPTRNTSGKQQPLETASQSERARTAVILKHTVLGTPPPPEEELERQRQELKQKTADRLAKRRALVAERLERRRQRLEELKNGESRVVKQKSPRQLRQERKRAADLLKAEREREEVIAKREADRQERKDKRAKLLAKRDDDRLKAERKREKVLAKRETSRREEDAEVVGPEEKREPEAKEVIVEKAKLQVTEETIQWDGAVENDRLTAKGVSEPKEPEITKRDAKTNKAQAKEAKLAAKLLAESQKAEAKEAKLVAKREADRKASQAEEARLAARREAERQELEAKNARLLAREEAERQELEAKEARLLAKRKAQFEEAEVERIELEITQEEALQEQKAKNDALVAKRESDRKDELERQLRETKAPALSQPTTSPELSSERRADLGAAERTKREFAERARARKEEMARQKLAQRDAYNVQRLERNEARKKAGRAAVVARMADRLARQETQRRIRDRARAERQHRLAERSVEKEARIAEQDKIKAVKNQARNKRLTDRDLRKSELLADRKSKKEENRTGRIARNAERDLRKAKATADREDNRKERLVTRDLRKSEKLTEREGRKAAKLAERITRKTERERVKAKQRADREARRSGKLARKAARRAQRLARRAARKAARQERRAARRARRLARREARRLRRLENPPYWTAEPAVAIGLAARSGGSGDEKSLEAITVQALAGYHRGKALSLRAGLAATVINSKVSSTETTTETISQTAVVRIIQNPDGTQTEEMGTVQVPQTIIKETRFYNQLTSIDFPVLLGYRLQGNKYRLLMEAGPCLNLSSGGDAHIRSGEGFSKVGSGHFLGRRTGIGFLAVLSGEYKLTEANALIGGVRLQSFGKAFENPEVTGNATRVTTLSLQVGYRIRF